VSAWDDDPMSKRYVRSDSTHSRDLIRRIETAMRTDDWSEVETLANELAAIWATISEGAEHRARLS
jgi:hypothetical protein